MEVFGAGILIVMMIVFGISSLAAAWEASQKFDRDLGSKDEDDKE